MIPTFPPEFLSRIRKVMILVKLLISLNFVRASGFIRISAFYSSLDTCSTNEMIPCMNVLSSTVKDGIFSECNC